MKINIRLFGQLTDITKQSELEIPDVKNTDELNQKLVEMFPKLAAFTYTMAINKMIIRGNTILNNEDTVALLPPFSGG